MRQFIQTIWWWLRVLVLVVVGLYAVTLLWLNSQQPQVKLWYWFGRPEEQTSIVALALASFVCGALIGTIGWALFSATVAYRRTREHRRRRLVEERRRELARKANMLRTKPPPAPIVRPIPAPAPVVMPPPAPVAAATPVIVMPPAVVPVVKADAVVVPRTTIEVTPKPLPLEGEIVDENGDAPWSSGPPLSKE